MPVAIAIDVVVAIVKRRKNPRVVCLDSLFCKAGEVPVGREFWLTVNGDRRKVLRHNELGTAAHRMTDNGSSICGIETVDSSLSVKLIPII